MPRPAGWKKHLQHALATVRRRVPPGLRLVLGIVLIGLGFLGFLPVLGFWLIPLGGAIAALDLKPLYRRLRGKNRRPPTPPER